MVIAINYNSYSDAIRSIGQVIIEVSQIDAPELTISDDEHSDATVTEWVELVQGTDYWKAWTTIQEIVRSHTSNQEVSYDLYSDSTYSGLHASIKVELYSHDTEIGILAIEYSGKGTVLALGEYVHPATEVWDVFYEGIFPIDDVDPIAIGRKIASIELSYLATEVTSCAAIIDYWQTHPDNGWYRQHEWAEARGVNRQTVNDRIRDAKENLSNH